MKYALYEICTDTHRFQYMHEATEFQEKRKDYIRISSIEDVKFVMIPDSDIIPSKVQALRAEKVQVANDFDEKISRLLAIEHQV